MILSVPSILASVILIVVMPSVGLLARTHVRLIAHHLSLVADPVLTNSRLCCITLPFLFAGLYQVFLHGPQAAPLLMQAGLLACAVADAEREWLPDSYTLPLLVLSLYASPLPGYERWPIVAMVLVVMLLSALATLRFPGLLPGRGDYMLWGVLTCWGGLIFSILILPAVIAAALTMKFTGRDHTPLGPWMSAGGALLIPIMTDAQQQLFRFTHFLLA